LPAVGAVDYDPGLVFVENQHGSIALADMDGDGNLELLVLMVDNPPAPKSRAFRIGAASWMRMANVTGGWTQWFGRARLVFV